MRLSQARSIRARLLATALPREASCVVLSPIACRQRAAEQEEIYEMAAKDQWACTVVEHLPGEPECARFVWQ